MPVSKISLDHDICHRVSAKPFPELGCLPFPHGTIGEYENLKAYAIYETGIDVPVACPETYEAVAWYIKLMPNPPKVSIHTANPIGRRKLQAILGLL